MPVTDDPLPAPVLSAMYIVYQSIRYIQSLLLPNPGRRGNWICEPSLGVDIGVIVQILISIYCINWLEDTGFRTRVGYPGFACFEKKVPNEFST